MKRKILGLTAVCAFLFCCMGCSFFTFSDGYTVWCDIDEANYFMSDGDYDVNKISSKDWKDYSMIYKNENSLHWTVTQIKEWLSLRGFDEVDINYLCAWFISNEHAYILKVVGNEVYLLIK